jgi:hypothetical protein
MDLRGILLHSVLHLSAVVAMVSLNFTSSYSATLWTNLRGVVGAGLVTVLDWSYFLRSPLRWHEPL